MQGLDGKVAIVTGSGSGIGRSTALLYAQEGVKVMVSDVDESGGNETVRLIEEQGGQAQFFKADVSQASEVEQMVRATVDEFGGLHFACNNAGISTPNAPISDFPLDGWDRLIAINLSGVFYCMKYQIPEILRSGGGAIVNVSSIAGVLGLPTSSGYVASKHGVIGLTKSAAAEFSGQGIRVMAVCPAYIETPMLKQAIPPEAYQHAIGLHPIGRLGTPEDVANTIVWLCSDGASFLTGSAIMLDGGYTIQ